METLTAAVVLAWLVLIVLAFALAGLLHQLRDVQASLVRLRATGHATATNTREVPQVARPQDGKTHAAVLLVDEQCPICAEVAPGFAALAAGRDDVDFVVLSYAAVTTWSSLDLVRSVTDPAAYHLLDPGWRPAIVVVDPAGAVVAAEPAGSAESIRAVIRDIPDSNPAKR